MSLQITYLATPGDEASRITINVPRSFDADSPEAVAFFLDEYQARRALGDNHGLALSAAMNLTKIEFPKSDLVKIEDPAQRAAAIAASAARRLQYRIDKGLDA